MQISTLDQNSIISSQTRKKLVHECECICDIHFVTTGRQFWGFSRDALDIKKHFCLRDYAIIFICDFDSMHLNNEGDILKSLLKDSYYEGI